MTSFHRNGPALSDAEKAAYLASHPQNPPPTEAHVFRVVYGPNHDISYFTSYADALKRMKQIHKKTPDAHARLDRWNEFSQKWI